MKLDKKFLLLGIISSFVFFGTMVFGQELFEKISVKQNSVKIFINDKEIPKDNFIYKNNTYIPLRTVGETLKSIVYVDQKSNTTKVFTGLGLKSIKLEENEYTIDGVHIKMPMNDVKKIIGNPNAVREESFRSYFPYNDDVCTIWEYDKYLVVFKDDQVIGIVITNNKYKTSRGIKIGDDYGKLLSLYGKGDYNDYYDSVGYSKEYEDGKDETDTLDFTIDKNQRISEIELRLIGY